MPDQGTVLTEGEIRKLLKNSSDVLYAIANVVEDFQWVGVRRSAKECLDFVESDRWIDGAQRAVYAPKIIAVNRQLHSYLVTLLEKNIERSKRRAKAQGEREERFAKMRSWSGPSGLDRRLRRADQQTREGKQRREEKARRVLSQLSKERATKERVERYFDLKDREAEIKRDQSMADLLEEVAARHAQEGIIEGVVEGPIKKSRGRRRPTRTYHRRRDFVDGTWCGTDLLGDQRSQHEDQHIAIHRGYCHESYDDVMVIADQSLMCLIRKADEDQANHDSCHTLLDEDLLTYLEWRNEEAAAHR